MKSGSVNFNLMGGSVSSYTVDRCVLQVGEMQQIDLAWGVAGAAETSRETPIATIWDPPSEPNLTKHQTLTKVAVTIRHCQP